MFYSRHLHSVMMLIGLLTATISHAAPTLTLEAAIADPQRSAANRVRDPYRHPLQTLTFFGVKPTSTVIEVWPGAGWYTEILAPYLRAKGQYIAAISDVRMDHQQSLQAKLETDPARYDRVVISTFGVPDNLDIRPKGGADVVLTFRNIHNWMQKGWTDAYFKAFFNALKPGGVLGVVEHRAKPGTTLEQAIQSGYVPEAWVIERAEAAGFKLAATSEINANSKDTKDYPNGVWSLPPTLNVGDADPAKFIAIGESDRMTLRFVKPK